MKQVSSFRFLCRRHFHKPSLHWGSSFKRLRPADYFTTEKHWRDKVVTSKKQATKNEKKYILSMFPYPSGNLHMGHARVYTISDCLSRYYALRGFNVLHPMGWDAFGLPAENAAIERGENPTDWTKKNISNMREQFDQLSCRFDWERELSTCDPKYYRWTQWIFVQMFKSGLVYQRNSFVNWDPVDCTVLAHEQIDAEGRSWRSGAKVEQKLLKQWFVKTAKFSRDKKYNKTDDFLDVCHERPSILNKTRRVFISNSHELWKIHEKFQNEQGLDCLKATVLNPINGQRMQIILGDVSTFHSQQDARFDDLENHSLNDAQTLTDDEIIARALSEGWGGHVASYKVNDWVVSRQRYWGTPIPMIHCRNCGAVPVDEADLPVVLPKVERIVVGQSTLASVDDWIKVTCPQCKSPDARRETDTLDTFFDSAWYFLRYLDPNNDLLPFAKEKCASTMPVDVYIGGKEHAILHLYYARLFCHFLNSIGLSTVTEPFTALMPPALVMSRAYKIAATGKWLPKDNVEQQGEEFVDKETKDKVEEVWEKMSKSKYNGVSLSDVFQTYGSDMTRLLMIETVAPTEHRYWGSDDGFHRMNDFLNLLSYVVHRYVVERKRTSAEKDLPPVDEKVEVSLKKYYNRCIKKVSYFIGNECLVNAALADLITLTTILRKKSVKIYASSRELERSIHSLVIMLFPFAPNMSAELWSVLNTVEPLSKDLWSKGKEVWEQTWPANDSDAQFLLEFNIDGVAVDRTPFNQQQLDRITVADALRIASKMDMLQESLQMEPRRIVDCRLERVEFFGLRAHLTVEPTDDVPLTADECKERRRLRALEEMKSNADQTETKVEKATTHV